MAAQLCGKMYEVPPCFPEAQLPNYPVPATNSLICVTPGAAKSLLPQFRKEHQQSLGGIGSINSNITMTEHASK